MDPFIVATTGMQVLEFKQRDLTIVVVKDNKKACLPTRQLLRYQFLCNSVI